MSTQATAMSHLSPPACAPSHGLRSVRGIHWLLLAGALVSAVSAFRLVASRWALLGAPLQYLLLAAGALSVYAAGDVVRHRLHLRHAGAALLALFGALLPVLAWGAAALGVVATPLGALAFAAALVPLMAATRRVLVRTLRYDGRLYAAVVLTLFLAPSLAPRLSGAVGLAPDTSFILAALGLGVLVHVASLHVNRFFFHRDRRDGVDRPVHFMPFLTLAALYAATLAAFHAPALVALPMVIWGATLVLTGEEYHRALIASGATTAAWPRRSLALLAVGFSLVLTALPLAFLDPSQRASALVACVAGWLLVTWGIRHVSVLAFVGGLTTAVYGYHFLPSLARDLTRAIHHGFTATTGIAQRSPALWSFGHVTFFLGLLALGTLLKRTRASARLRRSLGVFAAVHLAAMVGISLLDRDAAAQFMPVGFALAAAALVILGETPLVVTAAWSLVASTLVYGSMLVGEAHLVSVATVRAVGVVLLALAAVAPWLAALTAKRLRTLPGEQGSEACERVLRALVLPLLAGAYFVLIHGLYCLVLGDFLGGVQLALAGAVTMAVGHRLRLSWLIGLGFVPLSLGLHLLPLHLTLGYTPLLAATTLGLFALGFLAHRLASDDASLAAWRGPAAASLALHAFLGFSWFLGAIGPGELSPMEPLVFLALGLALADQGLRGRKTLSAALGLGALVLFVPIELNAYRVVIHSTAAGAGLAGLILLVLGEAALRGAGRVMSRVYGRHKDVLPDLLVVEPIRQVQGAWSLAAAVVATMVSGPAAVALAVVLAVVLALRSLRAHAAQEPVRRAAAFWSRPSFSSGYLALLQLALLFAGTASGYLVTDMVDAGAALLPLLALLSVLWLILLDATAPGLSRNDLRRPAALVEAAVGLGFVVAFLGGASLAPASHVLLMAVAAAFLLRRARFGVATLDARQGWLVQAWAALAVVDALTAGWLTLGSARAPWLILAAAMLNYALARGAERAPRGAGLAAPADAVSWALPAVAGALALARTLAGMGEVWPTIVPVFLASLFYLVEASRGGRRVVSALLAVGLLNFALVALVLRVDGIGREFIYLGPGAALILLSHILRRELGPSWTRNIFTAGASFVYLTPMAALYDQLTWGWQAVLLICAVVFGAMSFVMRSRSLLTVSTAALCVDLACFVVKIRATEPMLLWVVGLLFGLAIMAFAAWLEHQREGVLQRIRIYGHELRQWH